MKWKYGLIKIKHHSVRGLRLDAVDGFKKNPDDYCEIVALYQDEHGEYNSYEQVKITSYEELVRAYNDIHKDGVNTWFAENGTFNFVFDESGNDHWNWTPDDGVILDPEEEELYKVYGGD